MGNIVGDVEEIVTLDQAELVVVEDLATAHDVTVVALETKSFEPMTTVTVVLLGAPLAVATVMRLLDERRGGQVIDLRPAAPTLAYRTRDLHFGLILIHAEDGTVRIERLDTRTMFSDLIAAVVRVAAGTGGRTADAIGDRLERQLPAGQAQVDVNLGIADGHP